MDRRRSNDGDGSVDRCFPLSFLFMRESEKLTEEVKTEVTVLFLLLFLFLLLLLLLLLGGSSSRGSSNSARGSGGSGADVGDESLDGGGLKSLHEHIGPESRDGDANRLGDGSDALDLHFKKKK